MKRSALRSLALFFENLVFTVLVPGTVTVVIPAAIVPDGTTMRPPAAIPEWAGVVLAAGGAAVYFWCLWHFAVTGRGTPAPLDHPKRLVVRGLYRYVRNPMYLGVLGVLLGEALFFQLPVLVAYTAAWWFAFHLFVVSYEEPTLRAKFGAEYERYAASVGRWLPGRAYEPRVG